MDAWVAVGLAWRLPSSVHDLHGWEYGRLGRLTFNFEGPRTVRQNLCRLAPK